MLDVRRSIKRRRDFDRDCGHLTKKVCTRDLYHWPGRDKLRDPFASFKKRQTRDLYAFLAQNRMSSGSDTLNCQNPHSPLKVFADMAEPCRGSQENSFPATGFFESLKISSTQDQDLARKMNPELKSQFLPSPVQSRELVIKRSYPGANTMVVSKRPYFSPLPQLSSLNSNEDNGTPLSGTKRVHFSIDERTNLPFTSAPSSLESDGPSKPGSILYQSKHCTIELLD